MYTYEVGKPYIPGKNRFQEGVEYNYRSAAHELRLFLGQLRPGDVAAGEGVPGPAGEGLRSAGARSDARLTA